MPFVNEGFQDPHSRLLVLCLLFRRWSAPQNEQFVQGEMGRMRQRHCDLVNPGCNRVPGKEIQEPQGLSVHTQFWQRIWLVRGSASFRDEEFDDQLRVL